MTARGARSVPWAADHPICQLPFPMPPFFPMSGLHAELKDAQPEALSRLEPPGRLLMDLMDGMAGRGTPQGKHKDKHMQP